MEGFKEHNCPNLLVKDGKFYLVNKTNKWRQGSNPYEFDNLEEYAEFVEEQQKMEINVQCYIMNKHMTLKIR